MATRHTTPSSSIPKHATIIIAINGKYSASSPTKAKKMAMHTTPRNSSGRRILAVSTSKVHFTSQTGLKTAS
jgi:hypothetical protein